MRASAILIGLLCVVLVAGKRSKQRSSQRQQLYTKPENTELLRDADRNYGVLGDVFHRIWGIDVPNSFRILLVNALGQRVSQFNNLRVTSASMVEEVGGTGQVYYTYWQVANRNPFGRQKVGLLYANGQYKLEDSTTNPSIGSSYGNARPGYPAVSTSRWNPFSQPSGRAWRFNVQFDPNGTGTSPLCSATFLGTSDFYGNTVVDPQYTELNCGGY